MKTNRTEKQHHVSKFYLDYFKDSEGRVWTYDAHNDKSWARPPESTARQKNLYTPKGASGEYLDDIEDWLADVEKTAAPLYARVIEGDVLEEQERADFSVFLGSLYTRTPTYLRSVAEIQGYLMQFAFEPYLNDRDLYDDLVNRMDKENGVVTSKENRDKSFEFGRDKDGHFIEVEQHTGLAGIAAVDKLAPVLFGMQWNLLIVQRQHLITSDNPVVRISPPEDDHPIYGDSGFYGRRSQVSVPLSPTRLLLLLWPDDANDADDKAYLVGEVDGQLANLQRAFFSSGYLYSSKEDPEIRDLARKYKDTGMTFRMSGMDRFAPVNVTRAFKD